MKFVIQRVKTASVAVENNVIGKIDNGFLVLINIPANTFTIISLIAIVTPADTNDIIVIMFSKYGSHTINSVINVIMFIIIDTFWLNINTFLDVFIFFAQNNMISLFDELANQYEENIKVIGG